MEESNRKYNDAAFEKILLADLQRTIEFLKYAEAKNGALLTFASAWALASANMVTGGKVLLPGAEAAIVLSVPFFLAAGGVAMLSFFPRMHLPWFLGGKRAGPHAKNLLYFGDIAGMTALEFKPAIQRRYCPAEGEELTQEYLDDLMVQLLVNSQITRRKLWLFRWGLILVAIAALISMMPLLRHAAVTVGMALGWV